MNVIEVKLLNGILRATKSSDDSYPGIWIEYIDDNDHGQNLSRPQILMESPNNQGLRCLIWNDKNNEDYTDDVEFNLN